MAQVRLVGLLAPLALIVLPRSALAVDKALAEQLFRKAQTIMQSTPTRDELHQACQLYKESYDEDSTLNTQVALAACWEKEGKNVSAWGLYVDAASGAGSAASYAKERAAALLAKGFLKVRFDTKALPADARVAMDGHTLGSAALSMPLDADPGEHTVTVTVSGKDFEKKFDLTAAQSPLSVTLTTAVEGRPTLKPAVAPAGDTGDSGKTAAAPVENKGSSLATAPPRSGNETPIRDKAAQTRGGGVRTAGVVMTVASSIGLTAGIGLTVVGLALYGGGTLIAAGVIIDVVTLGLLTTGIVMIATGGPKPVQTSDAKWHFSPYVGATGAGAILERRF